MMSSNQEQAPFSHVGWDGDWTGTTNEKIAYEKLWGTKWCWAECGESVVFLNNGGHNWDREFALKHFSEGAVLTVTNVRVGASSSSYEFAQVPGKRFNTVMFGPALLASKEGEGQ